MTKGQWESGAVRGVQLTVHYMECCKTMFNYYIVQWKKNRKLPQRTNVRFDSLLSHLQLITQLYKNFLNLDGKVKF